MITIDCRTRPVSDGSALEAAAFLDDYIAPRLQAHGLEAGRAAQRLGLVPLTLDVAGTPLTFIPGEDGLAIRPGSDDALVVALDQCAFSDLISDRTSTFGAQMTGRATIRRGTVDAFVEWEPVLRHLLDGRTVYEPGSIEFRDRDGAPLELRQSFSIDDEPERIGHFLAQAGFLHISGLFTESEMAAVSAELDEALAASTRDDGASWWARTTSEGWYPARILGFNRQSPTLRSLLTSDRFTTIGTFTDDQFQQRDPDLGDTAEGLLKKIGVVEGASDVSWHKDCTMGGHSRQCSSLVVGISVTGAGTESGELGVVAGSHRANVATLGVDGVDLPRLPLPTRTGDVTVHCSCTLHMSRPPISAERRVVYTGFGLAPQPDDSSVELSPEEIRRQRAELNDRAIAQQFDGSSRLASHEL